MTRVSKNLIAKVMARLVAPTNSWNSDQLSTASQSNQSVIKNKSTTEGERERELREIRAAGGQWATALHTMPGRGG